MGFWLAFFFSGVYKIQKRQGDGNMEIGRRCFNLLAFLLSTGLDLCFFGGLVLVLVLVLVWRVRLGWAGFALVVGHGEEIRIILMAGNANKDMR